jgi:hypothetical protein
MSFFSRLRSIKRPTCNARKQVKQHAATRGEVVTGTGRLIPAPFHATPGHRNLGLIPRRAGGYRMEPDQPKTRGAFGGVTKTERNRRAIIREAAAKAALVA